MAVVNGYITLVELKATLRETGNTQDAAYERAINAASRQIDDFTGRQFYLDDEPSEKTFRLDDTRIVWTGDYATTTDMTVEVQSSTGSAYTPLGASEWLPEPLARRPGRPYDRITLSGVGSRWRCGTLVKVTAQWGWPSVPDAVKQACLMMSIDHWKAKDLTGGIAGFGELGPVRVAAFSPQARQLLAPFREWRP